MKKYLITVKGISYEVEVEEIKGVADGKRAEAPAPAAEVKSVAPAADVKPTAPKPSAAVSEGKNSVTSPMPGTILKVNVKVGDSVKKGAVLMILEAMKMENEIMAPNDAVVASVAVSEGASVSTGDVLVAFN